MKSFDASVLASFFIDDSDDREAAKQRPAATLALAERGFVGITVLLEFERVMRGFYQLPRADISRVLRALAGVQHIALEDRRSTRASAFVTFDKRFANKAKVLT